MRTILSLIFLLSVTIYEIQHNWFGKKEPTAYFLPQRMISKNGLLITRHASDAGLSYTVSTSCNPLIPHWVIHVARHMGQNLGVFERKSKFSDPPPVLIEYINIHWQAFNTSNTSDDNWTTKEISQIWRIYPRQNWQPGAKSLWESKRQNKAIFGKFLHIFVFVKWRPFLCRFCSV